MGYIYCSKLWDALAYWTKAYYAFAKVMLAEIKSCDPQIIEFGVAPVVKLSSGVLYSEVKILRLMVCTLAQICQALSFYHVIMLDVDKSFAKAIIQQTPLLHNVHPF